MFEPHARNHCEGCLLPLPPDESVARHLLDRISIQEVEILNLRQLEESIRRNTHLFEALLRKSHEGIVLVTAEMTFLRVVHAAFGHTERELVGQPVLFYVHPDDQVRLQQDFSALLSAQSGTAICQCRVRDQAGTWVWAEIEMTDLLDDPQVQAIVFNYRPI